MNNIFLIGMMGSGKTTSAREIARLRGFKAVDLDVLIEDAAQKTVNDIFAQDGEPAFRMFEKEMLRKAAQGSAQVIATGGGIVLAPENIQLMRESGTVIYLKTSFAALWERVKDSTDRPLLKVKSPQIVFRQIFDFRTPLYERAAHHVVATDGKTTISVAREIDEKLQHEKS